MRSRPTTTPPTRPASTRPERRLSSLDVCGDATVLLAGALAVGRAGGVAIREQHLVVLGASAVGIRTAELTRAAVMREGAGTAEVFRHVRLVPAPEMVPLAADMSRPSIVLDTGSSPGALVHDGGRLQLTRADRLLILRGLGRDVAGGPGRARRLRRGSSPRAGAVRFPGSDGCACRWAAADQATWSRRGPRLGHLRRPRCPGRGSPPVLRRAQPAVPLQHAAEVRGRAQPRPVGDEGDPTSSATSSRHARATCCVVSHTSVITPRSRAPRGRARAGRRGAGPRLRARAAADGPLRRTTSHRARRPRSPPRSPRPPRRAAPAPPRA